MANLSNINNKFLVTTGGDVGIGVTSPGEKLDVDGNIRVRGVSATKQGMIHNSGSYFSLVSTGDTSDTTGARIWLGNNASANAYYQNASTHYFRDLSSNIKMTLLSSGNLGIGTDSPSGALHVKSSTATTTGMVRLQNDMDNNYETLRVESLGNYDAHIGFLANGTSAYWWGIGIDYSDSGKFKISGDNILSVNPRLTIDTSGNVGIGTTLPGGKLQITSPDVGSVRSYTTSNGFGLIFDQYYSAAAEPGASYTRTADMVASTGDVSSSQIRFLTKPASSNPAVAMLISGNGNVGIGTTSPQSKLHINKATQTIGTTIPSGAVVIGDSGGGNMVLELGQDRASISYIQSRNITSNTAYNLAINPSGGNVGIGTTAPAENFVVADATLGNGIELVPAGTGTIQAYNRGTSLYNTLNIDSLSNRIRSINETVFQ
jgi:hypothetical protein